MTIQGAIAELQNLLKVDDVPFYYKGGIQKVIETIQMEIAEPLPCHKCESVLSSECTACDGQRYFRTEEGETDCPWK